MNFIRRIIGKKVLKPKDIAYRIGKIMDNNRTESVFKTYVPCRFRIFLSKEDCDKFEPYKSSLIEELTDYINSHADKKKYHLSGQPEILFSTKENFKKGKFKIEAILQQDKMDTGEQTVVFGKKLAKKGPSQNRTMIFGKKRENNPVIEVLKGNDRGSKYKMIGRNITFGRRADNQIMINDTNVSRYHARIINNDGWKIEDLNSTNGVYVNGKRVKRSSLEDKDEILVGSTVLRFRIK